MSTDTPPPNALTARFPLAARARLGHAGRVLRAAEANDHASQPDAPANHLAGTHAATEPAPGDLARSDAGADCPQLPSPHPGDATPTAGAGLRAAARTAAPVAAPRRVAIPGSGVQAGAGAANHTAPRNAPQRSAVAGPRVPLRTGQRSSATATAGAAVRDASPPWYRGNWPLYLFLFLLPLQNIQTGYLPNFGFGLNFLNLMFLASLACALLQGGRLAPGEPVNRWLLAYICYAVASLFVGYQNVSNTGSHFAILKDHLLGLCVVFIVQMNVSNWREVRKLVLISLAPLPYIAKVVWAQHLSVSSWHYSDNLRINGTFALLGANEFSAFCVTMMAVLVGLLVGVRSSWKWRAVIGIGIGCMLLGVLYTYSRTGYVAAIAAVLTVVLAWRGRWKMLLPLLLAAAIVPPLLPPSVVERFDSTSVEADKRDESTELRFEFWQLAWDNFTAHPLLGSGFQTFWHPEINPHGMDTHNFYMRSLTEGGLVGIAIVLGLFIAILRLGMRELRASRFGSWRYGLALGLCGVWVAMVIGNLFGDRFTYYPMIAYLWLYVALVMKSRHLPPDPSPRGFP